ncbi:hypothetical protein EUTSA_v10011365mg [Eutrema salsugineum]|uniref:Jacalin-type lectin domain-containing protein n=1 Tax=Eutrema salsugineum TaxID=72664 RepID=V4KU32_EUTSA|nr:hypothetical protein EUTSA_v10011365mg [Eutrema salsugineum]
MTQRLEAQGLKNPESKHATMWDYGSDHGDIAKISVIGDSEGIKFIGFDYIKDGQLTYGSLLASINHQGFTHTFEINHLKDEQLVSVEGYYKDVSVERSYKDKVIQGLQFITNMRISELIGFEEDCTKFSLAVDGKKIIRFHGSYYNSKALTSLGAYFTWISPTRLDANGGYGGKEWDDGADHEGITKIYLRGGPEGIQYIKFDYVKDGQQIYGQPHGGTGAGFTQTFELNHLKNEYLVSVEGYYDNSQSGVIQGIQFKSNIQTSDLMGYDTGKKFRLACYGKKIIGFHGSAEKNLNSLGAYFTTLPIIKLESIGNNSKGELWDNGTFEGVRKFEVDYPNEVITSVEGTLYKTFKTSPTFGRETNSKFVLESKGCALVGLYGRVSGPIYSLGAYFRPMPPATGAEKLDARGGDGGASWDDGVSDGIRFIYIGYNEFGIAFVKFLYDRDDRLVLGDHHGGKTLLGVDEFELKDSPEEYLISVEGTYDVVHEGYYKGKSEVIGMLRFKTNKQTSPTFGTEEGSSFILEKQNHKIVGFHGNASTTLHKIGVHVLPIT